MKYVYFKTFKKSDSSNSSSTLNFGSVVTTRKLNTYEIPVVTKNYEPSLRFGFETRAYSEEGNLIDFT